MCPSPPPPPPPPFQYIKETQETFYTRNKPLLNQNHFDTSNILHQKPQYAFVFYSRKKTLLTAHHSLRTTQLSLLTLTADYVLYTCYVLLTTVHTTCILLSTYKLLLLLPIDLLLLTSCFLLLVACSYCITPFLPLNTSYFLLTTRC